jgi:hypothetical protein
MLKRHNAIFMRRFGEEVIFDASGLVVKAIVEPDTQVESLQTVQINHQSLLLYIDEMALKEKGVERRQSVTVRGLNYAINEIGNDLNGMMVMRVSRI